MTGGWAATNTLRDHLRGNGYLPQHEPMVALALVEAALDAAEALRRHDLNKPTLSDDTTYEEWARIRLALDANLHAALRAVREGK